MLCLKKQAKKLLAVPVKGAVLFLCLAMLFSSVLGVATIAKADDNTVTVTVNYVYESNSAMVAQPYTAQIAKGAPFQKSMEVPKLLNYSIPTDKAKGLTENIQLVKDDTTGKYTLNFALNAVDKDLTVTLYYVAGKATYTVYHYYQNLKDNEYTLDSKVIELTGDIDAYTQAVADSRPGFRCKGVPQTTIAADGTTKVEIYYDRKYYTVTFDVNGGIDGPEPIYAKYGTTFEAKTIKEPRRKGYTFLGWQPALTDTVTITENVTYTAQWQPEKGQADYTIVLWGQNASDNEYSYLNSHAAWGNVGKEIAWNDDTLISHVHTNDCWENLTCGMEAHMHTAECLNCEHTHDLTCYGLSANASSTNPNDKVKSWNNSKPETYFEKLGLENGYLYYDDENALFDSADYYYLRFNGNYYLLSSNLFNKLKGAEVGKTDDGTDRYKDYYYKYSINPSGISCTHSHASTCYSCGKTEHTHIAACNGTLTCTLSVTPKYMREIKPDSNLWEFERSDTVTVKADGTSVLNVYFKRKEFTLTFLYGQNSSTTETITDRWGANIKERFDAVETRAKNAVGYRYNLQGWQDSTTSYYTNNVMVMPKMNKTFTADYNSDRTQNTMTYYAADLNDNYQNIFTIVFYGDRYTVTEDEYYEWEGFKINTARSAQVGDSCQNAKFYYDRVSYSLKFYSKSSHDAEQSYDVKYEKPLGEYSYTPTEKPSTVEPDAVFVGWYQNPECTGEQYDLSAHTMPANNIALYAKWVNGLYTVRTYKSEALSTPYTYEGYTGVQENIEKYTLATAPEPPKKDGQVFIGWFYKENETEKPFSFTMPITKDYNLYPKFSEPTTVEYTVHYYKDGTTEKVADDRSNSVMIGTTVTEKAKMGQELNLLDSDKRNSYYPTNTSTSVIINQLEQEIIFYYTEAKFVEYTVYYQDANGTDLMPPAPKKTTYSTVTVEYVPIPNYSPRQFRITQDLSSNSAQNKIVFIYDPTLTTLTVQKNGWEAVDENQTFLFHIKGNDENTKNIELTVTVHGNGKTTVANLPIGSYTVTEKTDWSWRYTPSGGAEKIIKVTAGGAVLPFKNEKTGENKKWLNGDSFKLNHFTPNR